MNNAPNTPVAKRSGAFGASFLAVAVLATAVLLVDPGGYFIWLSARFAALCALFGLGCVAFGLRGTRDSGVLGELSAARPLKWWFAVLAWAVISFFANGSTQMSFFGALDRRYGLVSLCLMPLAALLGWCAIRGVNGWNNVSVAVSVLALMSVGATVGIERLALAPSLRPSGSRVAGTFGNANFSATFYVMALCVAIGAVCDPNVSRRVRSLHMAAALSAAVGLVMTQTRGAWIAAGLGVVVLIVIGGGRVGRKPGFTVAAVVALCALGAAMVLSAGVQHRITETVRPEQQSTITGRIETWKVAIDAIGERPMVGWGPDREAIGLQRAIGPQYSSTYRIRSVPDRAHQVMLDMALSVGIPGAALWMALMLSTLWTIWCRGRTADMTQVGVMMGVFGWFVCEQTTFGVADLDVIAWLLIGGLLATTTSGAAGRESISMSVLSKLRWAAVPVGALLLLAGWRAYGADRVVAQALTETRSGLVSGDAVNAGFARLQRLDLNDPTVTAALAQLASAWPDVARDVELLNGWNLDGPQDSRVVLNFANISLGTRQRDLLERAAVRLEAQHAADPANWWIAGASAEIATARAEMSEDAQEALDLRWQASREWDEAAQRSPDDTAVLRKRIASYLVAGRTHEAFTLASGLGAGDPIKGVATTENLTAPTAGVRVSNPDDPEAGRVPVALVFPATMTEQERGAQIERLAAVGAPLGIDDRYPAVNLIVANSLLVKQRCDGAAVCRREGDVIASPTASVEELRGELLKAVVEAGTKYANLIAMSR